MAHPASLACEHCRGNAWRRFDPGTQLLRKQELLQQALDPLGLKAPMLGPSPKAEGFRNSVKLRLERRRGRLVAGLYDDNSHRVLAAEACPDHHPMIGRLLPVLLEAISSSRLPIYREASGEGLLSHLVIRALDGQGTLVCLCLRDSAGQTGTPLEQAPWWPECQRLARQIEAWDANCSQVQVSVQRGQGNRVLGQELGTLLGPTRVGWRFLDSPVAVNSAAFLQANLSQYRRILEAMAERVRVIQPKKIADLFCGAGTIGLSLAGRLDPGVQVLLVEQDPLARDLLAAASSPTVQVVECPAHDSLSQLRALAPEVLVVNPPRKGLGEDLCRGLVELASPHLFYLSCGPASLARDLALLAPRWQVEELLAWDMIPNSPHVECLAVLRAGRPA
jgi:23S rRNA (uracil1939-C5)-methyltransferase